MASPRYRFKMTLQTLKYHLKIAQDRLNTKDIEMLEKAIAHRLQHSKYAYLKPTKEIKPKEQKKDAKSEG